MSFKYERFLVEAIEQCQFQKILTCIRHHHNIYIQNNHGQNLLVHLLKQQNAQDVFFEKKRLQIFQFLITQCNLNIYSFDCHGKNLFNWAANLNCTQEALYLLQNYPGDIDILVRDHTGLCSLHYAIEHGNEILVHAMVDYLLQYRIRFDIIDNHNNAPEELARKLGYDHISEYLAETCRSTIFMSRNIPFYQQRLLTNKSKSTSTTKISSMSSGLSSSTSSLSDITEFYQLIESKIEIAKNLNDWKTVALLRICQRNLDGRKSNQLPIPTLQRNRITTSSTSTPSPVPFKVLPNRKTSSPSSSVCEHMLRLIEPQLCPSYRRPFIPFYQKPIVPVVDVSHPVASQRRMSVAASRRMSSVMGNRKRESNASQIGALITQDGQTRLSLPPVHKRQSIVPSRSSDADALAKLRAKHMIQVQN